jgi:hypothetical protein
MPDQDLDQIAAVGAVADTDKFYLVTAAGFDGRATALQLRTTTASKITDFSSAADARITAQKGAANGVCGLDGSSRVPTANLLTSGANSVVLRDGSQNISVNSVVEGFVSMTADPLVPLVLTVASAPSYLVNGSGGQTIQLPNATTLQNGVVYLFNNNQSSGAISVNNNSGSLIATVPSGGFTVVSLLSNSIAAGSWERHEQAPSNVTWSTNTLDYPGSITGATWNGVAVAISRGGTGATTQQAAINALTGTQVSGRFLRSDGTNASLAAIQAADVPTLNQSTTGTAANVTGTVALANGGTGATSASAARTALGAAASGANTDITSLALASGTVSTAPSATTDIVNKQYADSIASGINFHSACSYATVAALSPAATYAQPGGATVGVGATLTGQTNTALQVDGVTLSVGQRILVKNQATTFQNGVYNVTQQGNGSTVPYILTRATDYDNVPDVQAGDFVLITSGTLANTAWVQQTTGTITFGTSAIAFAQFSSAAAGVSSFVTTLAGLTTTSSTGAVSLGGTLGIAGGGTGASNAQAAISELGIGMRMVEAQTNASIGGIMATGPEPDTFTLSAPGVFTTDGYTPVLGDIIAFALQGGGSSNQNGFWQLTTLGTPSVAAVFTRPSWFSGTVRNGMYMTRFGATQCGYVMAFFNGSGGNTDIIVGTTTIQVVRVSQRLANATNAINLFTGYQTFRANGASANQAPFFFQAGAALMTIPQAHAVEWFDGEMYLTEALSFAGTWTTGSTTVTLTTGTTSGLVVGAAIASGITGAAQLFVTSIPSLTTFTVGANPTNAGTATAFTVANRRAVLTAAFGTY